MPPLVLIHHVPVHLGTGLVEILAVRIQLAHTRTERMRVHLDMT